MPYTTLRHTWPEQGHISPFLRTTKAAPRFSPRRRLSIQNPGLSRGYWKSTTSTHLRRKSFSTTRPRESSAPATMESQFCTYDLVQP